MSEFKYIPEAPEQSFGNNKGIFTPKDIYDLTRADKYTNYGQLELIETKTVSGVSAVDFSSIGNYDVHLMTLNITDTSSATYLGTRFFEGGVLSTSTVYQDAFQYILANGLNGEIKGTRNQIIFTQSNVINGSMGIYIYFYNLRDSAKFSFLTAHGTGFYATGSVFNTYYGSGLFANESQVDGIRILDNLGTLSGTLSLYGLEYA